MHVLNNRPICCCAYHASAVTTTRATTREAAPVSKRHSPDVAPKPFALATRRQWLLQILPSVATLTLVPTAAPASTRLQAPPPDVVAAVDAAMGTLNLRGKAPLLLRLVFHDAGTFRAASSDGGLNASIQFELDRPENKGLKRAWSVVQDVHKQLQVAIKGPTTCNTACLRQQGTAAAGRVSKADLVAWLGAKAVALTGGPTIPVLIGRLPGEELSAAEQRALFAAMGLSAREMVALLGSHTLGGKGFGDPLTFDAAYYRALLQRPWNDPTVEMRTMIGIPTDRVLPDDPVLVPIIQEFAASDGEFFQAFAAAYDKLVRLGWDL